MLQPKNKKLLKKGSYSLAFTVVVLAIAVFLNLLIGELPYQSAGDPAVHQRLIRLWLPVLPDDPPLPP